LGGVCLGYYLAGDKGDMVKKLQLWLKILTILEIVFQWPFLLLIISMPSRPLFAHFLQR
jgi:hypothetical protein